MVAAMVCLQAEWRVVSLVEKKVASLVNMLDIYLEYYLVAL